MTLANGSDTPGEHWPGVNPAYRGRYVSEPSNAEVMRRLDDLQSGLKEDLSEIRSALPLYVPREVYEARHGHLLERVSALENEQKAEAEQRRNLFRWVVSAIVVPVVLFVIQQVQNAQGGGAT